MGVIPPLAGSEKLFAEENDAGRNPRAKMASAASASCGLSNVGRLQVFC